MTKDVLIPDPLSSNRQYDRFHHLDIADSEDSELLDELYALRPLLWGLPPEHWLRARVRMLEAELSRRQGDISREFSKREKSKPAEGVKL